MPRSHGRANNGNSASSAPPEMAPALPCFSDLYLLSKFKRDSENCSNTALLILQDGMTQDELWTLSNKGAEDIGEVLDCAYSPNSKKLVAIIKGLHSSVDNDCCVKLWDFTTGYAQTVTMTEMFADIFCDLNRAGTRMITWKGNTAHVWDLETAALLFPLPSVGRLPCFTGDDTRIVSAEVGESDRSIHLWDANTGSSVKSFEALPSPLNRVVPSLNGAFCVGNSISEVGAWDLDTGKRVFHKEEKNTGAVCVSNGDSYVVAFSKDTYHLLCWNLIDGATIFDITVAPTRVHMASIIFSPLTSSLFVSLCGLNASKMCHPVICEYDAMTGQEKGRSKEYPKVGKLSVGYTTTADVLM
jgi:WD40 repeat protein